MMVKLGGTFKDMVDMYNVYYCPTINEEEIN
jgi:hypothetical protein